MKDWDVKLAEELKKRQNPNMLGPIIGTVISSPPELMISILEGQVFITKCYVLDNLLSGYTRTISIPMQAAAGTTNSVDDGGDNASSHSHNIQSLQLSEVTFNYNDTLKPGDQVFLIPTNDNQVYFLVGKVTLIGQ